jgi:LmbE family N-acetylglucosaminyl deacetylase
MVRLLWSALLALTLALTLLVCASAATPAPAELEWTPDRTTRLLVLAPHPDDEALGAAGLIQRVLAHGGTVRVVLMTSGDGFPEGVEATDGVAQPGASDFRGYGATRERETVTALGLLGLPASQITFLGFPDEGLCRIASTYLYDKRRAFASPYTQRERPPATEQVIRGVRYRGVDVRRELETIITTFRPTLLLLPHPEDEHPDHCSTHIFAREALEAVPAPLRRGTRVLHYLVHYGQWPLSADAGLGSTLLPPEGFPAAQGTWRQVTLTHAEADTKKQALLAYRTQMLVIGRFMLAFGRTTELFLEGEPTRPADCWCDGENVTAEKPDQAPGRKPARP